VPSNPKSQVPNPPRKPRLREGWHGWDEYAPFYDWENAQTLGRRDVPFWRRVVANTNGPVLELGCGTGRVTRPLAIAGVNIVGVDRSAAMLDRLTQQIPNPKPQIPTTKSQIPNPKSRIPTTIPLVRADIRALPFADASFPAVIAPYGILQSLIRPRDLTTTLASVARVVAPGGLFGVDLVPDVPNWREYRNRVQLRGRHGAAHVTLVESVSQDRRRRLTTFEQRYIERRGRERREHRFELTFRTLTVPQMTRRLERAGFAVQSVVGDYRGRPWDARADVWIILAKRV
jgi:ubiquinone/menaquinone biosynthesis C-methylase UbiE